MLERTPRRLRLRTPPVAMRASAAPGDRNAPVPAPRPAPTRPGGAGRGADREAAPVGRTRVALATLSVVVLLACGAGWVGVRGIGGRAVLASSGSHQPDGSVNILLIGLDTRRDQNGSPLPQAILDQLHAGEGNEGGYNTNTLILLHVPNGGGKVSAFSIPRDDLVPIPVTVQARSNKRMGSPRTPPSSR